MNDRGFARTYGVELLYEKTPVFDREVLFANIQKRTPIDMPRGEGNDSVLIFHPAHPIEFQDATTCAQHFLAVGQGGLQEKHFASVEQTWDWAEASEVVAACKASLLVTDMMSSSLEPAVHLDLFHKVLLGVLETVPPRAIHWQPSQRIVEPRAYLESKYGEGEERDELYPAINVRLFRVDNGAPDESLMDSMGLAALGFPDVQCHFVGLEPQEVARALLETAYYVFDNADDIEDGHTVQGLDESQKWLCRHEMSIVAPQREVLDLNPGKPFAAGNRDKD